MNFFAFLLIGILFNLHSVQNANGSNILALLQVASPSHQIWNNVLLHKLADREYNLTIITVDLPSNLSSIPPNVHYIHLEETYNELYNPNATTAPVDDFFGLSPIQSIPLLYDYCIKVCTGTLKSKGLQTLMNYPDDFKFDLIIEDYTMGPCLLGLVHKFNYPPLIGISAFLNPPITIDLIGHHYFPAYIPYYSTTYDVDMSLLERIHNTIIYLGDTMYRHLFFYPQLQELVKPYFPDDTPSLREIQQRTVLALVNSHASINYPESLPPNVIEVGGLQIVDPSPLSEELEDWIQAGKKGAILFSLGTNVRGDSLGRERVQLIIDVLSQISDYNFLWKLDWDLKEKGFNCPENVLVKPFFPQRDILAHPKLKAFITHAGGLSTQEATWHGVPMIGLPLFMDQIRNLEKSILAGVAVKIDFQTLTEESLRHGMLKLLNDPSYYERMQLRSFRFRNRPMKPLDTAVWWIEYVLRDPKCDHLKSPALAIGFFIAHSWDVAFFFLLAAYLTVKLWKLFIRKFKQRSNKRNRHNKND